MVYLPCTSKKHFTARSLFLPSTIICCKYNSSKHPVKKDDDEVLTQYNLEAELELQRRQGTSISVSNLGNRTRCSRYKSSYIVVKNV